MPLEENGGVDNVGDHDVVIRFQYVMRNRKTA